MLKILYLSALSSERLINDIYAKTENNPGFAVQKFSRLLVSGLSKNGVNISTLTSPPVNKRYSKKIFISLSAEVEDGIEYNYIPILQLPILKHFVVFFYTFFYVLRWSRKEKGRKVVICDALAVSTSLGALFASKISSITCAAVVTDIWGLMVSAKSKLSVVPSRLNSWYVKKFDKYILLTYQMNEKVNPRGKPHIVMEALCDNQMAEIKLDGIKKAQPRTLLYAGGIHERYGLKMLAEAFIRANIPNAKLVYYGSGPYVEDFINLCAQYENLEYRGVAPNSEIVAEELSATLLINPRFSTEEFTKYSFPSKNMEYMASGTPLLTTKLPGMPDEYYPYIYMFENESIEGYAETIRRIMELPESDLAQLGKNARDFVLTKKNQVYQGRRILEFLNS